MIAESLKVSGVAYDQLPNHDDVPNPIPLSVGTIYVFKKAGVVLAPHSHDETHGGHFSAIITGSFTVENNGESITANPGDILDFDLDQPHSFTALAPGMIFNGMKHALALPNIEKRLAALKLELASINCAVSTVDNHTSWFRRFWK